MEKLSKENSALKQEVFFLKGEGCGVYIIDILMPEMDRSEAAKLIKKDFPDLPIIAQTA